MAKSAKYRKAANNLTNFSFMRIMKIFENPKNPGSKKVLGSQFQNSNTGFFKLSTIFSQLTNKEK